ncbi:MAG TPA: phenylalanine 4-monooxygenase [Terriglobales bacterium]|nr:phenylalanine 4-monooxygenase [Terriglobales bacterium]
MPEAASAAASARGLTTTEAPFIEAAQRDGQMYIHQPYELYSEENHEAWRRLFARMQGQWRLYANPHFLNGIDSLCFDATQVPRLEEVNRFLAPLTGFRARAVSGYVPAFEFFDCLSRREFPTTITIRRADQLDYLPEPDIFHDIAGHVPMHTDPKFADTLVRFGNCAHTAARLAEQERDPAVRRQRLTSMIKALARFFWFTVEFGLMRSPDGLRAYGSGLLSSYGELEHSLQAPLVQRHPIQMEWVVNQGFDYHHYQPLFFVVESFDHLFQLVDELERWLAEGRLLNVAPGAPDINDADQNSFLRAE